MGGNWVSAYSSWRIADLEADAASVRGATASRVARLRPFPLGVFWRGSRRPLAAPGIVGPDPGEQSRPVDANDSLLDPALAR
jgi:hypothetical protein